jgi:hypothetical protein
MVPNVLQILLAAPGVDNYVELLAVHLQQVSKV